MATRSKAAFFLPAFLLLIGLAILLFKAPSQAPVIASLFFVFILFSAVFQTIDVACAFAVGVSAIELTGVALQTGAERWALIGHIPCLWLMIAVVHGFQKREALDDRDASSALQDRQKNLAELHREKESLTKRLIDLTEQAALRRVLFDAVQQMASLLDPVVIRQRLMEFVRSTIGRGTIQFFAGHVPRDLLDKWVMERRLSLLVTDVMQDARFKNAKLANEVRSVLAAPMIVEKQWVGLVRVNGFEPDLFNVADLRVLEALTLMAALALENLQLLHRLKEGAVRDNLTGLYTHRFFEERLAQEILSAGRFGTEFSILLMDIDHFKRYNDTYGHAAGDEVLVRFSTLLQHMVRPVDFVARYGGEEFIVILPQIPLDQARAVAEQVRRSIEAEVFRFGSEGAANERVTVSIGISGFPHEATTASQLVRVADMRLYQAKQNGRNQVVG